MPERWIIPIEEDYQEAQEPEPDTLTRQQPRIRLNTSKIRQWIKLLDSCGGGRIIIPTDGRGVELVYDDMAAEGPLASISEIDVVTK